MNYDSLQKMRLNELERKQIFRSFDKKGLILLVES